MVYNDLKLNVPRNYTDSLTSEKLLLKSRIELENINFKYPNTDKFILKNLNLIIDANSTIGIVGKSGSGKTTLVDLIIGILNPTDGKILVDKKDMIKTKRAFTTLRRSPVNGMKEWKDGAI